MLAASASSRGRRRATASGGNREEDDRATHEGPPRQRVRMAGGTVHMILVRETTSAGPKALASGSRARWCRVGEVRGQLHRTPGTDDLRGLAAEVADLRRRLEDAEAVLAVQTLKADYGDFVDRRFSLGAVVPTPVLEELVGHVVSLFTEDAEWDGGPLLGVAVGRDAIAARLLEPTLTFSRHLFVKPRISVDGDAAHARWDLLCPCRTPDGKSWWMCGYEDDEYRRDTGVWRHRSMRLTTVFMAPAGEGFERILV
jgi:SnoaL-like protein